MSIEITPNSYFKKTEIGDIPSNWNISHVGEVFDVQQGKALSPRARKGISPRPFLRTANVLWGQLDLNFVDQMDFTDEEVKKLALQPGDLLVCEGGEIGRTAIWNGEITDCLYQNHIHRLRKRNSDIDPAFTMYWMQAAFLHLNLYGGVGNRTTIPNLSGARLKQLSIPKPPLQEQKAIAGVLGKIQAAIEVQDKIVAMLKELKAATMAKLFRKGLRGELQKETEIGRVPESWKRELLGNIAEIAYGVQAPVASATDPLIGTLILTNVNISIEGGINLDKKRYYRVPEHQRDRLLLAHGDVLFNWRSGSSEHVGKTAYFDLAGEFTYSSFILRFRPHRVVSGRFLFRYLSHIRIEGFFSAQRNVSSINSVYNASLSAKIPIWFPTSDEQDKIVAILDEIDRKIATALKQRDVFRSIFSSMLHLLMTGKVRVNNLNLKEIEGHEG